MPIEKKTLFQKLPSMPTENRLIQNYFFPLSKHQAYLISSCPYCIFSSLSFPSSFKTKAYQRSSARMERNQYASAIILSAIILLGLVSFTFCIAAEFKKSKKKDLRLDGKLCYLPGTVAFEMGIAALIFLFIAQITGNLLICKHLCSRNDQTCSNPAQKLIISIIFLTLSWVSFGAAIILIGAASSMNRNQRFGEGWLNGECYIVKDGVYIGSALLILIILSSTISSSIILMKGKREAEQGRKVHAQAE